MNKKLRQQVYNKFGGLCAYTGKPLAEDWQVDHINPAAYFKWGINGGDANSIDNLVPCLRRVNHYKRCRDLEDWRRFIGSLHERLKRLPKKTRAQKREKTKQYLMDVAEAFGITPDNPFNGKFYFEKIKVQEFETPSHR